jgi:FKBP-type peptidyl-prolyl cis-trans isomerase FkpA
MKKIVLVLSALGLLFSGTSCLKDNECQDKTIQSEAGAMSSYAASNGITGVTHSSGIYYQITTTGTGPNPTLASSVSIRYTGKLLDGTTFDSQTGAPVTMQVGGTIPGFQLALQLLQEGGTIKVLIPSALAYGCEGNGPIPGNSVLYFEIQLVDIL